MGHAVGTPRATCFVHADDLTFEYLVIFVLTAYKTLRSCEHLNLRQYSVLDSPYRMNQGRQARSVGGTTILNVVLRDGQSYDLCRKNSFTNQEVFQGFCITLVSQF